MSYNQDLRPQFHFSPRKNWMNDPNGCVFHNGLYHLFFQYHPEGIQWGPMHWGHAISRDLIFWEEKEIALYPDILLGMIFSGSGIIDKKNASGLFPDSEGMIFFYTSHKVIEGLVATQQQCIAFSRDDGLTLEKYSRNPVISNMTRPDFRDPKVVYHPESESWVMAIAAGTQIDFFSSRNLLDWTREKSFSMDTTPYVGTWECPDLFPLHHPEHDEYTVWILAVSIQVKTQDPTQFYLCGDFNGHEFIPFQQDKYQIADYGLDFYAAQSWSNAPENAVTWIGWCNNWNYAAQTPDTGLWRGTMSLPRKVSLICDDSGLMMIQQPIQTLEQLREMKGSFSITGKDSPPEISLEGSDLWEISLAGIPLTLEEPLELTFLWNQGDVLRLWFAPHEFIMDRSSCGSLFSKGLWNRIRAPLASRTLTDCRILLDRGLIEVFLDGGRSCMTNQIFPSGKLEKLVITPGNRIEEIKGFPLRSIWDGM